LKLDWSLKAQAPFVASAPLLIEESAEAVVNVTTVLEPEAEALKLHHSRLSFPFCTAISQVPNKAFSNNP
jgi:hypothetical protein